LWTVVLLLIADAWQLAIEGLVTGREVTVERVLSVESLSYLQHADEGSGSVVAPPATSGVEPQLQTIFGGFVRLYACVCIMQDCKYYP